VVISLAFVLLTANAPANGVLLLFACLGLVHVAVAQVFAEDPAAPSGTRRAYAAIRVAASIALCAISLHSAYRFDRLINRTRVVNDMYYSGSVDRTPRDTVLEPLRFLVWATPPSYKGTLSDFAAVIRYFEAHRGNFLLIGDSSILYALTGRPSVGPVLWFHPGQTLPLPGARHFPAFQERLSTALRKYDVRYVVVETTRTKRGVRRTWSGVNVSTFPELERLLTSSGIVREVIGPFTIVEITGASGAKRQ